MEKLAPDGPKWGQEDFFLLIQTLPTFWATRILNFDSFYVLDFLDPKFPDFQVPDFQISRNPAWARLGPGLGLAWAWAWARACPAWARAWVWLGPGLGPETIRNVKKRFLRVSGGRAE